MESKLTIQQPKPASKGKAIASLVAGIISVISDMMLLTSFYFELPLRGVIEQFAYFLFSLLILGWIFPVLGLILGIVSLKSIKKNLAIIGIILSLIGLVGVIYIYIIALRIGTA